MDKKKRKVLISYLFDKQVVAYGPKSYAKFKNPRNFKN